MCNSNAKITQMYFLKHSFYPVVLESNMEPRFLNDKLKQMIYKLSHSRSRNYSSQFLYAIHREEEPKAIRGHDTRG